MSLTLGVRDLVRHTAWQRAVWRTWFDQKGPDPLAVTTDDHGDGRFSTIGGLIRHIFSSELRCAERIAGVSLTDTTVVAIDDPSALFLLGAVARASFLGVIEALPTAQWIEPFEFPLLNSSVRSTPRKVVVNVLTHETRHWAQVATLLRLEGFMGEPQGLLFSPVPGDPVQMSRRQ
jgi:uncharacterized damage-inducible protein DinB